MVEMINSLLDIHKFEAGRMVMKFSPEKPQHLLEKIVAQYLHRGRKERDTASCSRSSGSAGMQP